MLSSNPVDTPMVDKSKLVKDLQGKPDNPTHYRGMIGSLMYLTSSRLDLVFAVYMCARYQEKPIEKHLHVIKRISQYLKGTIDMGLWYLKYSYITLTAYADADHSGCQDTRQSTSGSAQFLGDKLVSWSSKNDNKSAIALCCNNVQQSRSKHIDVGYHFIKEQVENGVVELYFVRTEYQLADIFIKALPRERFNFLVKNWSMETASQRIKRRRYDLQSDGVKDFVMASERSRLKKDLESLTWRLRVDFSNLEMVENEKELESMEVYFLGRGLNLPVRPKEVEKGFAAALAILVTGTSQSRQHGKSESDSYYLSD
ncbi:hypothetical protein Tco_0477485 [Tanacetum coccineum]